MRIATLAILALLIGAPAASAQRTAPFALFPVVGGATYTDDYGDARPQGSHEGNDLMAPCGTPVIAVVDGRISVSNGSRSGWMVTLVGKRSWYRYIHMQGQGRRGPLPKGLRPGALVKAGTIIAYVGNTGDAVGAPCHLHFELHFGQPAVNPYRWLRQATIVQADPERPESSTVAAEESLRIEGEVLWVATGGEHGRVVIRPSSVETTGGKEVQRTTPVVLRLPNELVPGIAVGGRVAIATAPQRSTSEALSLRPLAWTVAEVRSAAKRR